MKQKQDGFKTHQSMSGSFKGSFCIDVGILHVVDVGGEYLRHGYFIIIQFDVKPEDGTTGLYDVTPGVVVNGKLYLQLSS